MKKKALIFAPHLDDELLIGGGLLYALSVSAEWDPYVIFMTNGDYFAYEVDIRLNEAIRACSVIGIDREHIIFLGYGDQWCGEKHIYNTEEPLKSKAQRTYTYALKHKREYSFEVNGIHNRYTRANLKKDIHSVIKSKKPDLCVVVDFDVHPDHRALSLLFEEVMGEILCEDKDYHPLILKKFAYENIYDGIDDYYKIPHRRTLCKNERASSNPYLRWGDRICLKTPEKCDTFFLSKNILYKTAKKYRSQQFKYIIPKAINSDMVYWIRRTDDLALYADVMVSSGNGHFLQDFKIIDTNDVLQKRCILDAGIWRPDDQDLQKKIELSWTGEICVDEIVFYEDQSSSSDIHILEVKFDDDIVLFKDIKHDGTASVLKVDHYKTTKLIISILEYTGDRPGLTEIEIFQGSLELSSYGLPCSLYDEDETVNERYLRIKSGIALLADLSYKFRSTLARAFPDIYYMARRYEKLRFNKMLLPFYWGIYIWQRAQKRTKKQK